MTAKKVKKMDNEKPAGGGGLDVQEDAEFMIPPEEAAAPVDDGVKVQRFGDSASAFALPAKLSGQGLLEIIEREVGKLGAGDKKVLMGEAAWRCWTQERDLVALVKRGAIETKCRIRKGVEVVYAPRLGGMVLIV